MQSVSRLLRFTVHDSPFTSRHVLPQADFSQRAAAQIAHRPDRARHRRRHTRVRIAAHGGRRLVPRFGGGVENASGDAQLHLAGVFAAVDLLVQDPADRRRQGGVVRELVWRRLRDREEFLPAVCGAGLDLFRSLPGVRRAARADARFPARSQGRDRRAQARQYLRIQDRRPGQPARHHISGHLGIRRARHLRRGGDEDRHLAVFFPVGLSERNHEEDGAAAREFGGRLYHFARRARTARPKWPRRSITRSGIRSRKR